MSNATAYALLVGVGEYRAFDPSGAADLEGPVNDVTAWLQLALDAGVPPDHIRICAEPAPALDALGARAKDITVGGATHAEIVAGLKWLAGALDGKGGTKGLLTWSGHGTHAGEVALLCPSDIAVDGDTLTGALSVTAVQHIFHDRAEHTRVTAMIDMCHTRWDGNRQTRALPWSGAVAVDPGDEAYVPQRALGDLVLTSSAEGRVSYELPVIAGVHGAFTFAAINLLRRWGRTGAGGGLTFAELAERAGGVLDSMGVPQTPRYVGADEGGELRVFSEIGDPTGSAEADALPGLEIYPGAGKVNLKLQVPNQVSTYLGHLSMTGDTAKGEWARHAQYWDWYNLAWPDRDFMMIYEGSGLNLTGNLQAFTLTGLSANHANDKITLDPTQSHRIYAIYAKDPNDDKSTGPVLAYMRITSDQKRIEVFTTSAAPDEDFVFASVNSASYFKPLEDQISDFQYQACAIDYQIGS